MLVFDVLDCELDEDGDGFFDMWEWEYGLNLNDDGVVNILDGVLGDFDVDGVFNVKEREFGMNLNDLVFVFLIIDVF